MCHSLFCLFTAISMFRWKTSEPAEKSPDIKDAAILLFCVFFSAIILLCQVLFLIVEKILDTIMWKMWCMCIFTCVCALRLHFTQIRHHTNEPQTWKLRP